MQYDYVDMQHNFYIVCDDYLFWLLTKISNMYVNINTCILKVKQMQSVSKLHIKYGWCMLMKLYYLELGAEICQHTAVF